MGADIKDSATVTGYAAVTDQWTTIAGLFQERIARGAFARTLRENPNVLAIHHHDYARVLGRTTAGTLRLSEDSHGLKAEIDLDLRTPDGMTVYGTVDRGEISGMSFSFSVLAETWEDPEFGLPKRTITDLELHEVTTTAIPAYPTTSISLSRSDTNPMDNSANARRRVAEREAAMRRRGIAV